MGWRAEFVKRHGTCTGVGYVYCTVPAWNDEVERELRSLLPMALERMEKEMEYGVMSRMMNGDGEGD